MITPDLGIAIERLQELVQGARTIVPFTGAGISTECGIPDFRSPGGLWTKNRPIPFDEFLASQEARNESWRRRFAMADQFGVALRGGHHCTQPLMRKLGIQSTARASFYFYNTREEVDRMIDALVKIHEFFSRGL